MNKTILLILFCIASSHAVLSADEIERMKFADGLHARGMHQLAVTEYEGLLKEFPKSAKMDVILFRLAESLRLTGKNDEADRHFRNLYIKYPDSPYRDRAGFRRADIHRRSGKIENAVTLYTLLLEGGKSPEIAAASLYYLGEIYLEQKKDKDAVKMFEKIRSGHAQSEFYFYSLLKLGSIYSGKPADVPKAHEVYKIVADKPPSPRMGAEALFQKAELFYSSKDYKNSADLYSLLLRKYPDDKRSHEGKVQAAWSQYNARRYSDALRLAESGLKQDGPVKSDSKLEAEWLYLKANCQRQLFKNSDASKTYGDLLRKYPDSTFASSARYEQALSFYKAGNYKEAVAVAESVKPAARSDAQSEALRKDIYWLLAESYAALKKDDDAVQYYRLIAEDFPKSDVACDAAYRLAYHLQVREIYAEASRRYLSVADNFPKSKLAPRALYASGLCLVGEGRREDAVRDWSRLLTKYPGHELVEETLYRKSVSEVRLMRSDTAVETLGRLLKEFPAGTYTGEAHYWRGALLKDAGKLEGAEHEFRLALKGIKSKELERDAQFFLAVVLHKRGKTDDSAKLFVSLIGTSAEAKFTPELLEWLSGYWYAKNDLNKARQCASVMLKGFSDDRRQQIAWAMIGRSYLAEKNNAKAEEAYGKALAFAVVTDYTAEAALRQGEIKLAAGKIDQAVENFERAAGYKNGEDGGSIRAYAYAGLAKSAKTKGSMAVAAKYYMSVAILYDEEKLVSECLYEAVKAFREQGQKEDAEKAFGELSRRYPKSPYVGQLKGQI